MASASHGLKLKMWVMDSFPKVGNRMICFFKKENKKRWGFYKGIEKSEK